jgi:hypothetical protein
MTCPSDWLLDRVMTGELRDSAVDAHLADCAECRTRRDAYARGADEFLARHPALPRPRPTRRRWRFVAAATTFAACAAALALVANHPTSGLRPKGGFALDVYVKRKSGAVERLDRGAAVHPRESIRFRASLPHPAYVAVVSIDPAGQVSSYLPASASRRELPAGAHDLDGSVELDDSLGEERLLALFCDAPVDSARLVADLTSHRDPPPCPRAELTFVKAP